MTTFTPHVGQRVLIKSTTGDEMNSYWFKQARDTRMPLVVTAVDADSSPWQVVAELRFEDGDNITWRFTLDEIECVAFLPKTGDLFARPGMEKIFALVISPERPLDDGYLCYALLLYPNGNISAPQLVVILPTDRHICHSYPLPEVGRLAHERAMQITVVLA